MSDNQLNSTDRSFDVNATIKSRAHSPYSGQSSSPFSSNISETELDASSLSPHSSCSSLNQLNMSASNSQSKLFNSLAHPSSSIQQQQQQQQSPLSLSSHPRLNNSDNINNNSTDKTRINLNAKKNDSSDDEADNEDAIEDDSNSSSNDILNSNFGNHNNNNSNIACINERLRNGNEGMAWKNYADHTLSISHELLGRKFSLNSAIPNSGRSSPSTSGRCSPILRAAMPPRCRVANIRRESNCSIESEAAHEKLIKTAQQVSLGFEEFCIAENQRKRTHSLSEPISILTNAFLPHSCSPSPTRVVDIQKQCYSPSTQQIVRNNITYSPSPSPTPSPTRRIMRSLSPIAVRQITKRRYTNSAAGGVDSDGESSTSGMNGSAPKRACITSQQWSNGGSSSPLANERLSYSSALPSPDSSLLSSSPSLPTADSSTNGTASVSQTSFSAPLPPYRSIPVDSNAQRSTPLISPMDSDDSISNVVDEEITSHSHSPPAPKQTLNKECDVSFPNESVSNKNDEILSSPSSSASLNNNIRENESL